MVSSNALLRVVFVSSAGFLFACSCPSREHGQSRASVLRLASSADERDQCAEVPDSLNHDGVLGSEPMGVDAGVSAAVDTETDQARDGSLEARADASASGSKSSPTSSDSGVERPGASRDAPLRVVTDTESGCPMGLVAETETPGRFSFSEPTVEDSEGTNETLRAACAIRQRIRLEQGYRLARRGEVVLRGEAHLTASGRGTVRLRVAESGRGEPHESHQTFGEAWFDGPFEVIATWPLLEACAGSIDVEVETLATVLLRAERQNTDPRRISLSTIELPVLEVVSCADSYRGDGE